jgi:catechol 2,3-dioxygenase-like lactoylglutathione lyase family enzyme
VRAFFLASLGGRGPVNLVLLGIMKPQVARRLCIASSVVAAVFAQSTIVRGASGEAAIVGIDHVSVAVRDLEHASERYRELGFSLKAGRSHADGIRNTHVKFPHGSGVELITASEPRDGFATRYIDFLSHGEGPVSVALHARNTNRLLRALQIAHIAYSSKPNLIALDEPALQFLFFVRDNRAPSDRPEHFAHRNSARAMTEVWIAPDDAVPLAELLLALGAAQSRQTIFVPDPVEATVFEIENGKIILLPKSRQLINGRPVVGVTFEVAELGRISGQSSQSSSSAQFVAPVATHGIWLAFRAAP